MDLHKKFKSYKFWVALCSAVILFLQTVGRAIGFEISSEAIETIVMAFCGVLVVLGFVKDDRDTIDSSVDNPLNNLDNQDEEKSQNDESKNKEKDQNKK